MSVIRKKIKIKLTPTKSIAWDGFGLCETNIGIEHT